MSSTIGVRNRTDTIKSNLKRNLSSLVTVSMFPVLGAGCKLPCAWQRLGLFAVFCKGFDLLPRLAWFIREVEHDVYGKQLTAR